MKLSLFIRILFAHIQRSGLLNFLSDKSYVKLMYFVHTFKHLDLSNPISFNEKLQYLKLHDRNPLYTTMVDKCAVKEYIAKEIGEQYVVPTIGVWNKFEEIDFQKLPDQFVLKCTHDSGGLAIVKDKKKFDVDAVKKKIKASLKRNFYYVGREWPYKSVPPRIIAEKFLDDNGHVPVDYKVYCFNGKPYKVMLCLDRDKDEPTKFYSFDFEWNLLRHNIRGKMAPEGFTLPKPKSLELM